MAGPILQFQSTIFARDDVAKLLSTLNRACGDSKLPDERLNRTFDVWWPRLESALEEIKGTSEANDGERDGEETPAAEETLGEILYLSRQNQLLLRRSTAEDVPKSVEELRVSVEESISGIRDDLRKWARERRREGRRDLVETYEMAQPLEGSGTPAPFAFQILLGLSETKHHGSMNWEWV